MRTVLETHIAGFPIKLEQRTKKRFRVTYGKQVQDRLLYSEAATELGLSIMHALACEGKLEDDLR